MLRLVLRLMQRPVQIAELIEVNLLLLSLSQFLLLPLLLQLCLPHRPEAAEARGQGGVGGEFLGRGRHQGVDVRAATDGGGTTRRWA